MSEEIKVGDRVEVYRSSGDTLESDVGIVGTVETIQGRICYLTDMSRESELGYDMGLADVRKIGNVDKLITSLEESDQESTEANILDLLDTFRHRIEVYQQSKRGMDRAAMLRTSMELTRALAKLRRG